MNGATGVAPSAINSTAMLVGEGIEEVICFSALLRFLGISGVQVEEYRGRNNLSAHLRALTARPGFAGVKVLGITRDADADPTAALASVRDAVQRAQFPSDLRMGVFVLPSDKKSGALEDLCLATLAGTAIERCFEEYFSCAGRIVPRSFETDAVRAKSRIHAWLAVQDPPDLRLGHAAQKGLIDWSSPVFDELKQFLKDLFA